MANVSRKDENSAKVSHNEDTNAKVLRNENGSFCVNLTIKNGTIQDLNNSLKEIQLTCEKLEDERLAETDALFQKEKVDKIRDRAVDKKNWEEIENVSIYGPAENKCARQCETHPSDIVTYHRLIGTKYYLCAKCYGKHPSPSKIIADLEYLYDYDFDEDDEDDNEDDNNEESDEESDQEEDSDDDYDNDDDDDSDNDDEDTEEEKPRKVVVKKVANKE